MAFFVFDLIGIAAYDSKRVIFDFDYNYNYNTIWDSLLIVQKEGNLAGISTPAKNGVQKYSRKKHNQIVNGIGFTCIDWCKESLSQISQSDPNQATHIRKILRNYHRNTINENKHDAYFTSHEVKQLILDKITSLPSVTIKFNIKKCSKCGEIGDPSFVISMCKGDKNKNKNSKKKEEKKKPRFKDREINVRASGRLHSFKWVWDGKVTDVKSGISHESRGWKSESGAKEHAKQELETILRKNGIIQ